MPSKKYHTITRRQGNNGLAVALIIVSFLQVSCIGLAFKKTGFNESTSAGSLTVGMTKEEVRILLGSPEKTAARQTQADVREVWIYRQTSQRDIELWIALSIATLGISSLFPVDASEYHYVVFSDGVVIGWDLPDPYAPDLIIEKRER